MSQEDFSRGPTELLNVQRRRRRRLVIVIALLLLLGASVFAAPHVRRAALGWQARRHARRAFVFIDQQKWREAQDEATTAYQLRPNEPEALRAVARLLSRSGQGDALSFWKKLASVTSLTRDDLREEIVAAVKANDLETADEAVQQLLKDDSKVAPADLVLATEVLVRENHFEQAIRLARKVVENPAATRQDKLQIAIALDAIVRNGGAGLVGDLKQIDALLVEIATGDDEVSLEALLALAKRILNLPAGDKKSQPAMPADEIIAKIDSHPLARLPQQLLAADLEISEHPDQRDQIEQRTIDRWKNGSDEDLVALAGWLSHRGEYQHELDAIPLERASQTRELVIEHLDALSALDRCDKVREILESEALPIDPMIQNMYLAHCDAKDGKQKAADNDWHRAIESAAGNPGKLLTLGDYAERNGAHQVAATAYDAAASLSPKSRPAQLGRLRAAYATNDTKRVHAVLLELLTIWPNDNGMKNDEAYVRLLLLPPDTKPDSPELKAVETLANKLLVDEPGNFPHRTLLALTLLKQNRPYSALALYRNLTVAANSVTPSTVAVYVAVLAAAGQTAQAKEEVKNLPSDKLLPEERTLIANQLSVFR